MEGFSEKCRALTDKSSYAVHLRQVHLRACWSENTVRCIKIVDPFSYMTFFLS